MTENKISLELFAKSFVSGDVITGVIHLDIKTPFLGKSVCVGINGKETFEKINQQQTTSPTTITREIFRKLEKVYSYEGVYTVGVMTFPFRFQLPANVKLPATFISKSEPKCSIKYKLIVFVDAIGSPRLRDAIRLVINERFDQELLPNPQLFKKQLSSKSSIEIKSKLSSAVLFPGEKLDIRIKVNSNSKKQTGPINVVLKHEMMFLRHSQPQSPPNSITPPLPPLLTDQQQQHQIQEPLPQREQQQKNVLVDYSVKNEIIRIDLEPFSACFYGERIVTILLPSSPSILIPTSTSGELIKSLYYVQISFDLSNSSNSSTSPQQQLQPQESKINLQLPLVILAPHYIFSSSQQSKQEISCSVSNNNNNNNNNTSNQLQQHPQFNVIENSFREVWEPDSKAASCNGCGVKFTLFMRRHHCRHCGKVFCGNCCSKRSAILNIKYLTPVRVCDKCFPIAQTGGISKKPKKNPQQSKDIVMQ